MNEITTTARDAMTVRRVFADPCVQDGMTVIPGALVIGGMGGGGGQGGDGEAGAGGGFGLIAMPAGAFQISEGRVRWHPALNANLVVVASTVVSLAWLFTRYLLARARLKHTKQ